MIYALKASEHFLSQVINERGYTNDVDLRIQKSKSEIVQIEEAKQNGIISKVLEVNFEKCRQCKLCTQICLNKAVYIANKKIEIDKEKCQGCGHCVSMCSENALTL